MKTKPCSWCKKEKPLERFYQLKKNSNWKQSTCKDCQAERKRELKKRNKTKGPKVSKADLELRARIRHYLDHNPKDFSNENNKPCKTVLVASMARPLEKLRQA